MPQHLVPSRPALLTSALLMALWSAPGHAEDKPKWELGLGATTLSLPDYRGSDESRVYALPIPYVVYRGDVIKADRQGARAELIDFGDKAHVDLGLNGSIPVSSTKNTARRGMPSLSGAIEVGPALEVHFYQSEDDQVRLKMRVPVTYGVTFGNGVGTDGWQASPNLNLDIRSVLGFQGWNLTMLGGPIYATRQRHAYFYDVAPQYATAERPAYRATAGYSGAQFVAGLSKRFDRTWVGAFMRYDNLNGAVFRDSPLVKTRSYLAGGVAVAWVLGQSSDMVSAD
ncbi:MAG: MipA/OmpV family protein [Aquabacterium sp.]|nr:MipA/OmpV family protein [Aquabacterium sp.]